MIQCMSMLLCALAQVQRWNAPVVTVQVMLLYEHEVSDRSLNFSLVLFFFALAARKIFFLCGYCIDMN